MAYGIGLAKGLLVSKPDAGTVRPDWLILCKTTVSLAEVRNLKVIDASGDAEGASVGALAFVSIDWRWPRPMECAREVRRARQLLSLLLSRCRMRVSA